MVGIRQRGWIEVEKGRCPAHLQDAGLEGLIVGVGLVVVQVPGEQAVLVGQADLDETCMCTGSSVIQSEPAAIMKL